MSALVDATEGDVASIDTAVAGALRVGAVASALRRLAVPTLSDIVRTYLLLRPEVVVGEGIDLLDRLEHRTLDLVVFESWDHRPTALSAGSMYTLCTPRRSTSQSPLRGGKQ